VILDAIEIHDQMQFGSQISAAVPGTRYHRSNIDSVLMLKKRIRWSQFRFDMPSQINLAWDFDVKLYENFLQLREALSVWASSTVTDSN
jgi:hypothetical protein